MTTFLLSDVVELKSYLRDNDMNGEPMPYKSFNITLERTGHTNEEILDAINAATKELLRSVDNDDDCKDFDRTAFNTCFTYRLDSERSYDAAVTGINDLKKNIRCIMLFSPKIDSIEIIDETSDGGAASCVYKRKGITDMGKRLKKLDISVNSDGGESGISTVYISSGELTEAANCYTDESGRNHFELFDKLTSRIFVKFPLIGTECFPFPLIINNIDFKPNEPRSGITLVDNEQSVDSQCNKEIMLEAVKLYGTMLTEALKYGFSDIENIINIPPFAHDKEMSDQWVKENIYTGLYNIITEVPFVRTTRGMEAISSEDLYIIGADNDEEKNRIASLSEKLRSTVVPTDNTNWWSCLKNYSLPEKKVITLKKMTENALDYVTNRLDTDKCSPADWCRELYDAAMENEKLKTAVNSGSAEIFPDRNCSEGGKIVLRPINKLKNGRDIL